MYYGFIIELVWKLKLAPRTHDRHLQNGRKLGTRGGIKEVLANNSDRERLERKGIK